MYIFRLSDIIVFMVPIFKAQGQKVIVEQYSKGVHARTILDCYCNMSTKVKSKLLIKKRSELI